MIDMLAKHMREHKNNGPNKAWVISNAIHACQWSNNQGILIKT